MEFKTDSATIKVTAIITKGVNYLLILENNFRKKNSHKRPYRLSYNQNLGELQDILQDSVTKHSISPWASLVVPYYKRYPLPHI